VLGGVVPEVVVLEGVVLGCDVGGDVAGAVVAGSVDGDSDVEAGESFEDGVTGAGDEASSCSNSFSGELWARAVSMPVPQSW